MATADFNHKESEVSARMLTVAGCDLCPAAFVAVEVVGFSLFHIRSFT
jgi:hypothetical protein